MILPDVNVLIYSFRSDSTDHAAYRDWLDCVVNGEEAYGMSRQVQDAWFAALAMESGCEWITTDGDYARFAGLRSRRPF